MTPDDVRALARAAAQLAALAQPDVAAVVAALPRRPGTTATLAEVAHASGLEMRTLGKAVTRGRDAGVLAVVGESVAVDPEGARRSLADLVALTPLGAVLTDMPELQDEVPYGLLHGVPTGERAADLLRVVADLLPPEELTEAQVTVALARLGDDPVGLRRALVDAGLLWRTADGSRYQREDAR